jgi:hypothetical protein
MLKRSLHSRSLNTPGVTDAEVKQAVDGLIGGELKVADVPTRLCPSVISNLTQLRKNTILERKDGLAAKMEELIGELTHGPQRYLPDTPEHPATFRSRSLLAPPDAATTRLAQTAKQLVAGARLDSVDIALRQGAEPVMKAKRVRQVARTNYGKSHELDRTVDACIEYEIDSRRLAPRLLQAAALEERLDDARERYDAARQRGRAARQQFDAIRDDAGAKLEDRLKEEMLDYGSHVPTSLPLEFSKFSGKLLDTRERQRKSAWFRRYEDAAALRKDALQKEKDELNTCTDRFARSFKLQRQHVLDKQDEKREGFHDFWLRKKQACDRKIAKELSDLRYAVEHWDRDLTGAKRSATGEMGRIRTNEKAAAAALPVQSRAAATQHRF